MATTGSREPISAAFDEIEGFLLPCLTLTLDSLLGRSPGAASDPRAFAAAVSGMADKLEGLTRLIERNPAAGLVGAALPATDSRQEPGALRRHG